MNHEVGVFSFRFADAGSAGLLDLFAAGRQVVKDPGYRWHGRERTDGPLYLFQYTWAGAGILEVGGQSWVQTPGTGFLVEIPGDHEYRLAPEPGWWHLSFVLFRPEGAERLWKTAWERLGPSARFSSDRGPVLALETLVHEATEGRIRDRFTASARVYAFLLELVRGAVGPGPESVPAAVVAAQRLLNEGWNRPWKLPEVARAVGLSPAHFHRTFHRHTGLTPLEWLTRRRVEKGVELLGAPGATVESVSRILGFADTGHFIRLFRRWTGTTPGALKANPSAWTGSKILLS